MKHVIHWFKTHKLIAVLAAIVILLTTITTIIVVRIDDAPPPVHDTSATVITTTTSTQTSTTSTTQAATTSVSTASTTQATTTKLTTAEMKHEPTTVQSAVHTTRVTTKSTTVRTTQTTATAKATTTQPAHECSWNTMSKTEYKSPAVGVDGYYTYTCTDCGNIWTVDLPGFSYGTATPAEVQAYALQYLQAKGCKINTSVTPWNTPCGFNSPMSWRDGQTLEELIPAIERNIEAALSCYGVDETTPGEPVTAYAEVPVVKEGVTAYCAGDLYIVFY